MDKHLAALVLEEIASLLALQDAERFRVRAYRRAARAVEKLEGDLAARLRAGDLASVPGLGPGTIGVLREMVETGTSGLYERLKSQTPRGLAQLRTVPGLGPKRIAILHEKLGVQTPEDLREAAEAGRIAALKGFGPATEKRILEGLGFVDRSAGRRRQPQAYAAAHRLIGYLEGRTGAELLLAGELRRKCETVDAVVLLAFGDDPAPVIEAFADAPGLRLDRRGETDAVAVQADGGPVRIRCGEPASLGVVWIRETGSDAHVAALEARARERGLTLGADSLTRGRKRLDASSEEAVYDALGLQWVPPELRESGDEVGRAAAGEIPTLVDYDDLRGTFHCHTTWSDGTASVAEMAAAARERGWRYLGIADHSVSAGYAGGLSVMAVRAQQREIDAWNVDHGAEVRVFKGIEADILRDGRLDYDDETLASFDYVIGSVHSGFRMGKAEMTKRLVAAVKNPRLSLLGHPTGRLLLSREPYPVDMGRVMKAAAKSGAGIEINGDPARMDLDWRYWPDAKAAGIPCAIDPDAHSTAGIGAVVYGLAMARKGGLEAEDVVNTWDVERVERWFAGT